MLRKSENWKEIDDIHVLIDSAFPLTHGN